MKPVIGQKVFINPIKLSNATRRGEKLREGTITKIGKIYLEVTLNNYGNTLKFDIKTGKHNNGNYSGEYQLYYDNQEIIDEVAAENLLLQIREKIGQYGKTNLTLEQLKVIYSILNP